jgi:hypothetical protein
VEKFKSKNHRNGACSERYTARGILINSYDDDENQQYYFLNGCPTVIQDKLCESE